MFEIGTFFLTIALSIPDGLGVNIHFTGERPDLDLIREGGFRFIRMDLVWQSVERERGKYDFTNTGYDELTEGCLKRGIRILYILDYSNNLYEQELSVRTEEGRKAFASFAEASAKRYANRGIVWEIWNEPNISQFWRPQPDIEHYCALVEKVAPLIKSADPTGMVVAPATSGIPFEWLEECFKKGLLKWIDGLTVHPYRPSPPETAIDDYVNLRNLIRKYTDKDIPIISGEWGYSLINWDKKTLSQEQQAQYLVRMFLVNLYQGIPISIWYDWKDDGTDPNEREHNFGTMTHDLKPKLAYLAAKAFTKLLNGCSFVNRIDIGSNKDFVLKFGRDGSEIVVLWSVNNAHEVKLPNIMQGKLFDMYGNVSDEDWRGDKITITQSPQYILLR